MFTISFISLSSFKKLNQLSMNVSTWLKKFNKSEAVKVVIDLFTFSSLSVSLTIHNLRYKVFIFEKASSIGLNSGLYGGMNNA
jgi:hypothetical protein